MKIICITLLLMVTFGLKAQSDSTHINPKDELAYYRDATYPGPRSIGIQIMPLSLRSYASRFRIGVIARMDRWSGLCDIEFGNEWLRDLGRSDSELHYYFFGVRPEVRYAWSQEVNGDFEKFYAIELPFNYYEREIIGGDFEENGITYTFERGIQKRLRHSIIFKAGFIANLGSRFFMEYYAGMGPAWRTIRYDNLINLTTGGEIQDEEWGLSLDDLDAGRKSVFDLAFGIRFGYWIIR